MKIYGETVYTFPSEDLQRFELTEQDLFNHVKDNRFTALMEFSDSKSAILL